MCGARRAGWLLIADPYGTRNPYFTQLSIEFLITCGHRPASLGTQKPKLNK